MRTHRWPYGPCFSISCVRVDPVNHIWLGVSMFKNERNCFPDGRSEGKRSVRRRCLSYGLSSNTLRHYEISGKAVTLWGKNCFQFINDCVNILQFTFLRFICAKWHRNLANATGGWYCDSDRIRSNELGRHGAAGGKSSESPFEISPIIFSSVRFVIVVFVVAFIFFHFRKSATNRLSRGKWAWWVVLLLFS